MVSVGQFCSDACGPSLSRPTLMCILKSVLCNGDALHNTKMQRPFLLHAPTWASCSCCPEAMLAGGVAVSLFQPCQAGYPARGCLCSLRPELHNSWSVERKQCLCPAYAIIWVSLWPLIFTLQHCNPFQGVKCVSNCAFSTVYYKIMNHFIRKRPRPCRTSWTSSRRCNFYMYNLYFEWFWTKFFNNLCK